MSQAEPSVTGNRALFKKTVIACGGYYSPVMDQIQPNGGYETSKGNVRGVVKMKA